MAKAKPKKVKEILKEKLPPYNWLMIPKVMLDLKGNKLFVDMDGDNCETVRQMYYGLLLQGYKVKSMSPYGSGDSHVLFFFEK